MIVVQELADGIHTLSQKYCVTFLYVVRSVAANPVLFSSHNVGHHVGFKKDLQLVHINRAFVFQDHEITRGKLGVGRIFFKFIVNV